MSETARSTDATFAVATEVTVAGIRHTTHETDVPAVEVERRMRFGRLGMGLCTAGVLYSLALILSLALATDGLSLDGKCALAIGGAGLGLLVIFAGLYFVARGAGKSGTWALVATSIIFVALGAYTYFVGDSVFRALIEALTLL